MNLRAWVLKMRAAMRYWDGRLLRLLANTQMLEYLRGPGWLEADTRHYAEWRTTLEHSDDFAWRLEHPLPCYAYAAIDFLESRLGPSHAVFEYGSGTSTLWLAKRVANLTSVEHDRQWADLIRAHLPPHVTLKWVPPLPSPPTSPVYASTKLPRDFEPYVRAIEEIPDYSLDLVCVDGRARPGCMHHSAKKLKPEGMMLLDNCHRPRYASAIQTLVEAGWKVRQFTGNGPYVAAEQHTAILTRS